MTKRYKIWFWVNVGVLVSIFVFKFLWEIGILSEELFGEHFEILVLINIPVFFVMLMLLIYSWRKEVKYKILSFFLLIIIGLLSVLLRSSPIILYYIIASLVIIFPLPFMFRRASYFYVFPLVFFTIIDNIWNLFDDNITISLLYLSMAAIALFEIIKSSINKQIPKHYLAMSVPLNIGIILLLGSGIVNFTHLLSFNSESVFISGCVIFSISLLYTFLSLPKSNFIDWSQQWKTRFWHYQIIPAMIFLLIMIVSLITDNFFSIIVGDIYAAYDLNFNEAIPYLHKPF